MMCACTRTEEYEGVERKSLSKGIRQRYKYSKSYSEDVRIIKLQLLKFKDGFQMPAQIDLACMWQLGATIDYLDRDWKRVT